MLPLLRIVGRSVFWAVIAFVTAFVTSCGALSLYYTRTYPASSMAGFAAFLEASNVAILAAVLTLLVLLLVLPFRHAAQDGD